jgi:hypothetical protein
MAERNPRRYCSDRRSGHRVRGNHYFGVAGAIVTWTGTGKGALATDQAINAIARKV